MENGERNFRIISEDTGDLRNCETMTEFDIRMNIKNREYTCYMAPNY